jgi:hypothetical protein
MRLNTGTNGTRQDVAESKDNAGTQSAEEPAGWGDVDLGHSAQAPAAPAARANRALGLAATQLQMPAPVPAGALDDDPVDSLFRADQTLRAPSIPATLSEAELKRKTGGKRASLFDENVADPVPPQPRGVTRQTEPGALPGARTLELDVPSPVGARAKEPAPALRPQMPMHPMPPPAVVPPRRAAAVSTRSGVRNKSAPELDPDFGSAGEPSEPPLGFDAVQDPKPAVQAAPQEEEEAPRRRRLQRGPKPLALALLGLAALGTIGSAVVMLGLVPNPLADNTTAELRAAASPARPKRRPPAPAQPAAAVAPKPAPAPVPAAAAKTAKPAVAPAPAAKVAEAPAAPAPQPAAAPKPEPAPVAAAPKPAAPAAADPEPADEAAPAASGDTKALMADARRALAEEAPDRAEAAMRQLLAKDPDDHHAMELLVRALIDQDRGKDALPYARKMVAKRNKRVPYRLLLGDVLLMIGDEAGARAEWQAAHELAPTDKDVKMRLGM